MTDDAFMLSIIFRGHDEAGFFAHALGMGPGASPLTVLPGNERTADARYACLIVVKDYLRLTFASKKSGAWHYSSIEPAILVDVRAGRAVLVFDLSNEGPAYDADIFSELYAWIQAEKLPAGRCIWLGQNRLMAESAEADLGDRISPIQFLHYDYFIKLMAARFAASGTASLADTDPDEYLGNLINASNKDKLLLCLNATPRLSRALTVAALHHHQLLHRSLVSFPGMHYVKSGVTMAEVLDFLDHNAGLEDLRPWVHAVGRMAPLRVDKFQEQGNELVEKIDCNVYERTFFSLVTESDFAQPGIARVTEKTVKAFCMGHPTVVIGNAHSIAIMRNFGFQDTVDVFDRQSESMTSPVERFLSIFDEVLRQAQLIKQNPQGWLRAQQETSVHNHRYAVSGKFLAHYTETFDRPLVARMANMIAA